MKYSIVTVGAAILAGAVLVPSAATAAPANWGQEVKACNQSSCYPGGESRGAYVSGQARDDQGPGYGYEIHTLAYPGHSQAYPGTSGNGG